MDFLPQDEKSGEDHQVQNMHVQSDFYLYSCGDTY